MEKVILAFEREKSADRIREILETAGLGDCLICRSAAEVKRLVHKQRASPDGAPNGKVCPAPALRRGAGGHRAGQNGPDGPPRHGRGTGPPVSPEEEHGFRRKADPDRSDDHRRDMDSVIGRKHNM